MGTHTEQHGSTDITQSFYNSMASSYDKLFYDWQATTHEQAEFLDKIFKNNGFDHHAKLLDCACGIGTQAIGLALLGYNITASDISSGELEEAKKRATKNHVEVRFEQADFCSWQIPFQSRLTSSSQWTMPCHICFQVQHWKTQ